MKNKNIVTKIALGVAVAALIFSVVTLIRTIVIGSNIFFSCILVVGTTIIVAICAIMLYVLSNYEAVEEEDGEEEDEDAEESQDDGEEAPAPKKPRSGRIKLKRITPDRSEKAGRRESADGSDSAADAPEDEPGAEAIEAEVDELISDIESKNNYDLHNFE